MAIPLDVREFVSAEGLTQPDPWHSTWRALFTIGAYAGVVALAYRLDNPFAWAASVLICSLLLLANQAASHEAMHSNLYRSNWANSLAGLLWSAPIFSPFATYRAAHLDHHRFTHGARDTEPLDTITSVGFYFVIFPLIVASFTANLYKDQVLTLLGRPPSYIRTAAQRRLVTINTLVQAVTVTGVVVWGIVDLKSMLLVWAGPFLVSMLVIFALVVLPEHYGCEYGPGSPFQTTRSTRSNALIRFLFWGTNWHTAHHLVPSIPSQKLHRLQPLIAERSDHLATGYVAYHLGILRDLRSGQLVETFVEAQDDEDIIDLTDEKIAAIDVEELIAHT